MSDSAALMEAYGGPTYYAGIKVAVTKSITKYLLAHPFWSNVPLPSLRKETRARVRQALLMQVYEPCTPLITETGGATVSLGEDGKMVHTPLSMSR